MKKWLALFLTVTILLGMTACSPSGGEDTEAKDETKTTVNDTAAATDGTYAGQLLAGFGKADITPTESVPLQGYNASEDRMSTGMKSYLYQIALAITDPQGNTAIVISSDTCDMGDKIATTIREKVQQATGVPIEHIIISSLHHHSTPHLENAKVLSSERYRENLFIPGAVAAAVAAMENRAPCTVQTASVATKAMNFVRHYITNAGGYAGDNFGDKSSGFKEHAAEPDKEMVLIKFIREGQTTMDGKKAKDIILTNYQGHPLMGTSATSLDFHSDVIGVYRDALEAELDCHAIYFTGASGNVEFKSRIASKNITADFRDHGKKLAQYAVKAEGIYTDVSLTAIQFKKLTVTCQYNHSEDHRYNDALRVQAEYNKTGDKEMLQENGFNTIHQVNAIITKYSLPETKDLELLAIALGDVAFIAAPYEMFCDSGMEIKEGSPFKTTVITTLANGGKNNYMPTMKAWDYGCYEQNVSRFVRGTAERLVEEFSGMLDDLYDQY